MNQDASGTKAKELQPRRNTTFQLLTQSSPSLTYRMRATYQTKLTSRHVELPFKLLQIHLPRKPKRTETSTTSQHTKRQEWNTGPNNKATIFPPTKTPTKHRRAHTYRNLTETNRSNTSSQTLDNG